MLVALLAALAPVAGNSPAAADPPSSIARVQGVSGILRRVPRLGHFQPDDSHDAWTSLKDIRSARSQHRTLKRKRLHAKACRGLVDMRTLAQRQSLPFTYRDDIRGRSWARPTLARVLADAYRRFRKEFPEKTISIGDISQPGCGQLDHGTLVRHLEGDEALTLINQARLELSVPTVVQWRPAGEFVSEAHRFEDPNQVIRVEHSLLAARTPKKGPVTVRVATRRHIEEPPTEQDIAELDQLRRKLVKRANLVSAAKVLSVAPDGSSRRLWRSHWVDRRSRWQLIAVTDTKVRRTLDLARVSELRLSRWHPKKPGSFKGELRWVSAPETTAGWKRYRQLYEAGHISHHSGRDADLSYVTQTNEGHFAVDLEAIDVAATWRWFQLLELSAKKVGVELELILVDRAVKKHLARHLPRKARRTSLFKSILRLSAGHDGHHHVRVAASTERKERAVRRQLASK